MKSELQIFFAAMDGQIVYARPIDLASRELSSQRFCVENQSSSEESEEAS